MTVQNIPPFSADAPSNNTFLQEGFTLSGQYYRPRFDTNVLAEAVVNVRTSDIGRTDLNNIEKPFFSTNTRRVFYQVRGGLHLEFISNTQGHRTFIVADGLGSATKTLLFVYNEDVYFLTDDHRIYIADGNAQSPLTLINTNLSEELRSRGLQNETPTNVEVFNDRLHISYGNSVIWSDTNDITEFRPEYQPTADQIDGRLITNTTEFVPTNAGFQEFQEGGNIIDMVVDGDFMYLFFQRQVWQQRAAEVQLQFNFVNLAENLRYHGGAIATRNGVYFYANNAYYHLTGEVLTKVSEPIHVFLTELTGQPTISSIVFNDNVYSVVADTGLLTVYNLNYGTIDARISDYSFIGILRDPIRSIGDLTNTIGSYGNTIGSFETNESTFPVAFIRPLGANSVTAHCLELLPQNLIRFNLGKNDSTKAMNIQTISMPEIEEDSFTLRIKGDRETRWSEPIQSDRFGVARVYTKFHSPDVEISVPRNISISLINIDFTIVDR